MGRKKKTYPSFRRCVGVYFSFVKQKTGMNPVFDATQGRALKKIIDWLEGNLKENKSDDNIINGFKFILDRHDQWEDFYKIKSVQALGVDGIGIIILNYSK